MNLRELPTFIGVVLGISFIESAANKDRVDNFYQVSQRIPLDLESHTKLVRRGCPRDILMKGYYIGTERVTFSGTECANSAINETMSG